MLNKKRFVSLSAFLFVTSISLNALSQSVDKTDVGIAEKNSFSYFKIYSTIETSLKKTIQNEGNNLSDAALAQTRQLLSDFANTCGDSDSLDSVSWKAMKETVLQDLSGAQKVIQKPVGVSFSCAISGADGAGAVFNFVVEREPGKEDSVVSLSKQDLELKYVNEKDKNAGMKLVVKESIAMAAGVAATFVVISKAFPGENDKILHGVGSSLFASALTSFLYHQMGLSKNTATIVSIVVTTALGYVVEEIEPKIKFQGHHGDRDMRDLQADMRGALVGGLFMRLSFEF